MLLGVINELNIVGIDHSQKGSSLKFPITFRSLKTRVVTLVMVSLVLFTVALGVTAYTITRHWLEEKAVSHLESLASARQVAIEMQLDNYLYCLRAFIEPDLEIHLRDFLEAGGTEREVLRKKIISEMRREQTAYPNLRWSGIYELDGNILISTKNEQNGQDPSIQESILEGQRQAFISNPFLEDGRVLIHLSAPLQDVRNNTIAVVVLLFEADEILSITGDYTGLGSTGETVLGARKGDQVHFLSPLRFNPNMNELAHLPPL